MLSCCNTCGCADQHANGAQDPCYCWLVSCVGGAVTAAAVHCSRCRCCSSSNVVSTSTAEQLSTEPDGKSAVCLLCRWVRSVSSSTQVLNELVGGRIPCKPCDRCVLQLTWYSYAVSSPEGATRAGCVYNSRKSWLCEHGRCS